MDEEMDLHQAPAPDFTARSRCFRIMKQETGFSISRVSRGMALRPLVSKCATPCPYPIFECYLKPTFDSKELPPNVLQCNISRRMGIIAVTASTVLARESISTADIANALDFRMVAPDQTAEQAQSGLRDHAQSLLQVKALLDAESWREAQKALRASSASLKQDIYTLINAKQARERPQLRKLYSDLFISVTKLDYAARDQDASRVQQWYENVAVAVDGILSKL